MAKQKRNTKGLKPWPKGKSGNPAGLPKGYIRASVLFNELLNGKMPVIEGGKKKLKKRMDIMMMKAVADSISADSANERTHARESIISRIEGKPVQPITGEGGLPLIPPTIIVKFPDGKQSP